MTTVNKSFTALGVSIEFVLRKGQSASYSVSGTFTGFVYLERARKGIGSWDRVVSGVVDTGFSGTVANEGVRDERYRFRAADTDALTAFTGTAVCAIADVAGDVLQEFKDRDGNVIARITDAGIEVVGAVTASGMPITSQGVGAKNGATVTAVERGDGVIHQTVLTCVATPVTVTDDASVAQYGGAGKLYDFPDGLIMTLGAVIDGAVTLGTTGTMTDTWAGGVALGTATATTGATLVGTEADIMPEVDVAAATTKVAVVDAVSVATALTESGARHLDGTGTAKDLFLNLVVDDEATHTSGTGTFTGTVTFTWINLGDK